MNKIIKAVKSLSQQQLDRLRVLLKTKSSRNDSQEIISTILSFTGLDLILSHLKGDELKILNAVYQSNDGVTFGEIEKSENINPEVIEEIADGLSSKLLVYVLKNRQKLHNRLDKIFIIPEFRDFLNPLKEDTVPEYFKSIKGKLEAGGIPGGDKFTIAIRNSAAQKLVRYLFKSGGIATLSEAHKLIPGAALEKELVYFKEKGFVDIYHDLSGSFKTYIILDADIFVSMSEHDTAKSVLNENARVNNQYMLLLNLLAVYDAVSTYGLFFTRQKEFRKIDYLRLSETMYKIFDLEGKPINPEVIVQLCLYIFYILKCVSIKRDSVSISLKNIKDDLDDPGRILLYIINALQNSHVEDKIFSPPFAVPIYKDLVSIIKTVSKVRESPYSYLRITRILKPLSEIKNRE
ncbi:MAG: hypothetical protein MUC95_11145 [Spirochaetes bacterium]|nr:hypothetical protein [Spirochaetota bacterium]